MIPAASDQLFPGSRVFMDKEHEEALVRDCQKGDRRAFDALVRKFEKPVYNAAFRMLGNPDDAADVTQTTFLKLFRNLNRYNPQFRLFSWIYRIAINESIHQLNLRKPREPLREMPDTDTSEETAVRDELRREIQVVLMELQEDHRAVLVLRYFGECSYDEMGEILQLPEKTVKSRLYTARHQLKAGLQSHGIFPE